MEDYKEVTSSLEGRLYLLNGKVKRPSTNVEDFYQPRPETQAVVNSWLSLKASSLNIANKAASAYAKQPPNGSNRGSQSSASKELDSANSRPSPQYKPTVSGNTNAFTLALELAEPVIHLEGFDASHTRAHRSTVLRGLIRLDVVRRTTLKDLSLCFRGVSRTEWPESWRLRKLKKVAEETILQHSWDFLKDNPNGRVGQPQSFEPGSYAMNFELPLESSMPESINLPLGGVSYQLTASATADASSTSSCKQDVTFIRVPCACSLELSEPYGVHGSQHGLRYSFGLFAKSVAVGGKVPLSMRIASIPEVSWEKITIAMTEDVQYCTRDGLAHREQSRTKAILLEKRASVLRQPPKATRQISHTGEKLRHAHAAGVDVEKPPIRRSSTASSEPEVHLLEKTILKIPTCSTIQPDTAYSCIYVRHTLVITVVSRIDLDEFTHRNFEVQIKVPIQILTCKLNRANTTLPEYSENTPESAILEPPPKCGCDGTSKRIIELPELEEDDSMLERWTSGSIRSGWRHDLPGYDDLSRRSGSHSS